MNPIILCLLPLNSSVDLLCITPCKRHRNPASHPCQMRVSVHCCTAAGAQNGVLNAPTSHSGRPLLCQRPHMGLQQRLSGAGNPSHRRWVGQARRNPTQIGGLGRERPARAAAPLQAPPNAPNRSQTIKVCLAQEVAGPPRVHLGSTWGPPRVHLGST